MHSFCAVLSSVYYRFVNSLCPKKNLCGHLVSFLTISFQNHVYLFAALLPSTLLGMFSIRFGEPGYMYLLSSSHKRISEFIYSVTWLAVYVLVHPKGAGWVWGQNSMDLALCMLALLDWNCNGSLKNLCKSWKHIHPSIIFTAYPVSDSSNIGKAVGHTLYRLLIYHRATQTDRQTFMLWFMGTCRLIVN